MGDGGSWTCILGGCVMYVCTDTIQVFFSSVCVHAENSTWSKDVVTGCGYGGIEAAREHFNLPR